MSSDATALSVKSRTISPPAARMTDAFLAAIRRVQLYVVAQHVCGETKDVFCEFTGLDVICVLLDVLLRGNFRRQNDLHRFVVLSRRL